MSDQPRDLLAELQASLDRALGRRAGTVAHDPTEPVEPTMSDRDEARLMDGRAADDAAYEPDLDEYGRWS